MEEELSAGEKFFDIFEFELDIRRAAVVALAGMRRFFHITEESVHLFNVELSAGSDRPVAGNRCANVV